LKNNLADLLKSKKVTIVKMSLDTGLSRTTITFLAKNRSKRIDFNTLAVVCKYLQIEPNDFFSMEE
jgi:Predicted transcriptional regulator